MRGNAVNEARDVLRDFWRTHPGVPPLEVEVALDAVLAGLDQAEQRAARLKDALREMHCDCLGKHIEPGHGVVASGCALYEAQVALAEAAPEEQP